MKFIKDIKEDDFLSSHYLCKQKQSLKSRNGKTYLSLKLQDKTGVIDAKVWDLNNDVQNFEENDFIRVEGVVLLYQNELQVKVNKIRKSMEGEYEPSDYIPRTEKDISVMTGQLNDYIGSVKNKYIKELLTNILNKNKQTAQAFASHSAAKTLHHGYMGGLMEHSLTVAEICMFLCGVYKNIDRDILLAGALLHDIGKIFELSPFPDNSYTDTGQLLGHVYLGAELVAQEALMITNFPAALETLLKHCIVSHHGEYEFGSPKRPKIIEAFILFCADSMDAKVKTFESVLGAENAQANWAGYNKTFDRFIRKTVY